jgi:type III pantothenate kinase
VSSIGAYAWRRPGRRRRQRGHALTIDAVTARGKHRGGAIVPARRHGGKPPVRYHGIRRRAKGGDASVRSLFATDTASALAAGSQFAAAAFIDRAVAEAARAFGGRPVLFLTGGAAPTLERHLVTRARASRTWCCAVSPCCGRA